MRRFLKVGAFDPTQTLVALAAQPELWNAFDLRTTYPNSPHAAVDDILLWFNDLSDQLGVIDDISVRPFPAWERLPQVRPVLFDLMRRVEGVQLGRVMITRLPAGRRITPHADEGAPATYFERYQLPFQSLPGCIFKAGDEVVTMAGGECWWFDNRQVHEVVNNSADDRIALIADIRRG